MKTILYLVLVLNGTPSEVVKSPYQSFDNMMECNAVLSVVSQDARSGRLTNDNGKIVYGFCELDYE